MTSWTKLCNALKIDLLNINHQYKIKQNSLLFLNTQFIVDIVGIYKILTF